jgi:hypothetical protein
VDPTPNTAQFLEAAERERREMMLLLSMIDDSLATHRGVEWIERRLLHARQTVHKRLLDLNGRIERAGGDPMPRRRFERET